jgi:hypothetical protein
MEGDHTNPRRLDVPDTPVEAAQKRGLVTGLVVGIIGGGIIGGIIGSAINSNRTYPTPNQVGANGNRVFGTTEGRNDVIRPEAGNNNTVNPNPAPNPSPDNTTTNPPVTQPPGGTNNQNSPGSVPR